VKKNCRQQAGDRTPLQPQQYPSGLRIAFTRNIGCIPGKISEQLAKDRQPSWKMPRNADYSQHATWREALSEQD